MRQQNSLYKHIAAALLWVLIVLSCAPITPCANFGFSSQEPPAPEPVLRMSAPETAQLPLPCRTAPEMPPQAIAQLGADFAFVSSLKGARASALHRELFGPLDGAAYLSFFKNAVDFIGVSSCGGGPSVLACGGNRSMDLSSNYVKQKLPQVYRAHILFHEARHAMDEGGKWSHVRCPVPFKDEQGRDIFSVFSGISMAGQPACDDKALGAYGAGLIMLKNIQKFCSNCTGKVREDSGFYADDDFKRIIGEEGRAAILEDLYR